MSPDETKNPMKEVKVSNVSVWSLAALIQSYGEDVEIHYVVDGHSGEGWYVWSAEYPDEGSSFLTRDHATFGAVAAALGATATRLSQNGES